MNVSDVARFKMYLSVVIRSFIYPEQQTVAQQQQVGLLQNEMDKLRSDNVKLYEKIKFLQTYPSRPVMFNEDAENRYSTQYEERLDPFSSFSKKVCHVVSQLTKVSVQFSYTFDIRPL